MPDDTRQPAGVAFDLAGMCPGIHKWGRGVCSTQPPSGTFQRLWCDLGGDR